MSNLWNYKLYIPKFYGEGSSREFSRWLNMVDYYFDHSCYDDYEKVHLVASRLRSYALSWWEAIKTHRKQAGKHKIQKWGKMRRELKKEFMPMSYTQTHVYNTPSLEMHFTSCGEHLEDELRWGRHKRDHIEEEEATMPTLIIEEVVQSENEIIVYADEGDLLDDMPFSMDTYEENASGLFPSLDPAPIMQVGKDNEKPTPLNDTHEHLVEPIIGPKDDTHTTRIDCGGYFDEHLGLLTPTHDRIPRQQTGEGSEEPIIMSETRETPQSIEPSLSPMSVTHEFILISPMEDPTPFIIHDLFWESYMRSKARERARAEVKLMAFGFHGLAFLNSLHHSCFVYYVLRPPPPRRSTYTLHRGFLHKSGKLCITKGAPNDWIMKGRQEGKIIKDERAYMEKKRHLLYLW